MKVRIAAAAVLLGAAGLLAACSGPPHQGKVVRWQYRPPSDQSVDVSCDIYMGTGSSSRVTGSSTGNLYCLDWNTATEPAPQDCHLTLSSGATEDLDVSAAECRSYLGQQWPVGGSA